MQEPPRRKSAGLAPGGSGPSCPASADGNRVALILALIRNLAGDRSGLLLAAAACYIAAWVATLIWFIPGVIEFNKVDVDGPIRQNWPRRAAAGSAARSAASSSCSPRRSCS